MFIHIVLAWMSSFFNPLVSPLASIPSRLRGNRRHTSFDLKIKTWVVDSDPLQYAVRLIFYTNPDNLTVADAAKGNTELLSSITEEIHSVLLPVNVVELELEFPSTWGIRSMALWFSHFANYLFVSQKQGTSDKIQFKNKNVKKLSILFRPFRNPDSSKFDEELSMLMEALLNLFNNITDFAVIGYQNLILKDTLNDPPKCKHLQNMYFESATKYSNYLSEWPKSFPNVELAIFKNVSKRNLDQLGAFINLTFPPKTRIWLKDFRANLDNLGNLQRFPRNLKTALINQADSEEKQRVMEITQPSNYLAAIGIEDPDTGETNEAVDVTDTMFHMEPTDLWKMLREYHNSRDVELRRRASINPHLEKVAPFPGGRPKKTRRRRKVGRRNTNASTRGRGRFRKHNALQRT
jgi:hypothetical protein